LSTSTWRAASRDQSTRRGDERVGAAPASACITSACITSACITSPRPGARIEPGIANMASSMGGFLERRGR
jgi:hypothetical protein